MKTFKKILYFLSPVEKKYAGLLLFLTFIMALIEMLGIASIMPFLAVLTNPNLIETNSILNQIYQASTAFGIITNEEFIFMLGIIVLFVLVFSVSLKALITYAQSHFSTMREYSVGKRLLEVYLRQPYSWFLNRNSADLGKTILSEVGLIIGNGLGPMISLISQSMVTIALVALLLFVDFKLTLIVASVIGAVYLIIFKLTRRFLNNIGEERLKSNQLRFIAINEAFGASKEIKVSGLEQIFINNFSNPSMTFAKHQASLIVVRLLPRYAIEVIAFGGMLLLTLYIFSKTGIVSDAIPIIALYAFTGYRLLPAIQEIYQASATLKFYYSGIDTIYKEFKNLKVNYSNNEQSTLQFNKAITLNNISYSYPNSSKTSLKNINLTISCKKTVGIIGVTGCGKTTVVDIITGLLDPQKGSLEVDGQIINKNNIRAWQRLIGYVPQNIYLSDTTIAKNIAFSVDPKNINQESIEQAAKIANLHEFVKQELPNQYDTIIGERGVRLSGGQRQRIGIARALYHKPKILILDEGTSSLDNNTESAVMEAISNLGKDITIIIIAHRLNSMSKCDVIYEFDKGELKATLKDEKLREIFKKF